MFLEIKNVKKVYGQGENRVSVLNGISTSIDKSNICVILGPSGSGKSTFLNAIGGLDVVDSGDIIVDGLNISKLNSKKLELYRRNYLGYIFQFYNLIPNLTIRENIQVCEYLSKSPLDIDELIETIGLKDHQKKFPSQLSGGQQQRCAIARALVKNPKLLLCDEPTGALDYKTSKEILVLLEKINKKYGTTMLVVTHNEVIQEMAHQVTKIKDGMIYGEHKNEVRKPASELDW